MFLGGLTVDWLESACFFLPQQKFSQSNFLGGGSVFPGWKFRVSWVEVPCIPSLWVELSRWNFLGGKSLLSPLPRWNTLGGIFVGGSWSPLLFSFGFPGSWFVTSLVNPSGDPEC